MGKKEKIIRKIIAVVNKTAPDSELFLYGSRARGDFKNKSDWDILILVNSDNLSFDFETKFMDELYEIEIETGEIISPLIYTKKEWTEDRSITPLYENILKDSLKIK